MLVPIVIIQLALKFNVFDTEPFNTVFQQHLTLFVMITHLAHYLYTSCCIDQCLYLASLHQLEP
jgi:hypothetical protein